MRRALDERAGLDTATFVSGYPGSPLGTLDLALERLGAALAAQPHRPPARAERGAGRGGRVGLADGRGRAVRRRRRRRRRLVRQGPGARPLRRRAEARQLHGHRARTAAPCCSSATTRRPSRRRSRTTPTLRSPTPPSRCSCPADQQDLLDLGGRGVPAQPGLRVVGRRPHRHRGRRRHRRGRHRPSTASPPSDPDARGRRRAVAPRSQRHDPAARPRGAVARPPPAGRPGVGRGPGPRPRRRRRARRPPRHRVRRAHLPRRARRLRGVRRRPRRPRRRRHPHPQAGADLPGRPGVGARRWPTRATRSWSSRRSARSSSSRCGRILHEAGRTTPVRGKRDARRRGRSCPATGELTAERLVEVLRAVLPDLAPRRARGAGAPGSHAPPAARPARPHPGVLQRLPAQPLDRRARGLGHRRRRRLPRDDPLRAPPRRRAVRAAHADGRRGRALGRAGAVRRRPPHLPEPRRRHVQPLGQPRHPGLRGRRASTSRSSCSTTRRSP